VTGLSITEYAVLGLASDGEQSGYDMDRRAQRTIGFFWRPAKSKIYEALPRLERLGLVESRLVRQSGRPDKTLYRLTGRGDELLRAWVAEPVTVTGWQERGVLLLKLFFARDEEAGAVEQHLRRRRDWAVQRLNVLHDIEERAALDDDDGDYYQLLTLQQGIEDVGATLSWAERALDALAARRTARAVGDAHG
jgi:DNA-binding PadR family transcriptional regulator